MSLQTQIKEDMKNAMRERDTAKVTTLRGLMSACTNKLVELGRRPDGDLSDEEALSVLKTEAKRRKDSIEQYANAGREDLASDETAELSIIEQYLPETMSLDAIKEVVQQKMNDLGITDKTGMGQLMGAVIAEVGGQADGSDVKKAVDELLS